MKARRLGISWQIRLWIFYTCWLSGNKPWKRKPHRKKTLTGSIGVIKEKAIKLLIGDRDAEAGVQIYAKEPQELCKDCCGRCRRKSCRNIPMLMWTTISLHRKLYKKGLRHERRESSERYLTLPFIGISKTSMSKIHLSSLMLLFLQ